MAIDTTKILNVIQEKVATATTSTDTQELIDLAILLKRISGDMSIQSYANANSFPDFTTSTQKLVYAEDTGIVYMNSAAGWNKWKV